LRGQPTAREQFLDEGLAPRQPFEGMDTVNDFDDNMG
jgi:hypothetical protein